MLTYSLRNNQNTDTVFIKQLHFLMDTVKEQIDCFYEMKRYDKDDRDEELERRQLSARATIKDALVTYLAETVGKTELFSIFAEESEFDSDPQDVGEQYILSLFQLREHV